MSEIQTILGALRSFGGCGKEQCVPECDWSRMEERIRERQCYRRAEHIARALNEGAGKAANVEAFADPENGRHDTVTVEVLVDHVYEGPKSIMVRRPDDAPSKNIRLPKSYSQVAYLELRQTYLTLAKVTIPVWLAKEIGWA